MGYLKLREDKKERFWRDLVEAGAFVLETGEKETAKRMLRANEMTLKRCSPNSRILKKYRVARKELF